MDDDAHMIVECDCYSLDHIVRFSYWKEDDGRDELYISTHMKTWRPWWKRLRDALKHVLNIPSQHGEWDEVCMGPEQAEQLIPILQTYIDRRKLFKKQHER